jgi:glycosyltransferase involved in cell wall biosynthesis
VIDRGLIVFVTTELYPFTSGGIGRLSYNILKTMPEDERQRTLVITTQGTVSPEAFHEMFPGARLLELQRFGFSNRDPGLAWALQAQDSWLATSVRLLMMLQDVAARERIDYVEFPDWSGFGFATIQQKRLSGFLADTMIAVRLHSTEAMLVLHESRMLVQSDLVRFDLERVCLQDCDLIIGHLAGVAETTRRVFGIDRDRWDSRLLIADPPVTLNGQVPATHSVQPNLAERIVFSSKLQEIKRPEIFVRGAARFLHENPDFVGTINFACPITLGAYAQAVLEAVPADQRDRFVFPPQLSVPERDKMVAGSIVVFATAFESYCLAAYEAAGLGSVVVANHNNPAFGPDTPWQDGVNCITFDGSVQGLAAALKRCHSIAEPLQAVQRAAVPQAWQIARTPTKQQVPTERQGLAVIVVNQNEGAALQATIASLLASDTRFDQLILADDGSTDTESDLVLAGITDSRSPSIRVIRLPVAHGYASALNIALSEVRAPLVAVLRSGTTVTPSYLDDAVSCLSRDDTIGLVCGQVRVYSDADQLADGIGPMTVILGDAAISGAGANTYGEFGFVVRTDNARRIGFRPETGYLCDWAFVRSAVRQGVEIVASPAECIGRRAQIERDFGTPIDEYDRLRHILQTHLDTPPLQAPVMQLAMSTLRAPQGNQGFHVPDWYAHMLHNNYEPEVAFMAEFFGQSRLGRFIRTNTRFSAFMEKLVNWLSRLGPKG